jgi:glycosyltransferase involved in cell wall biosynthesis
MRILMSIHHRIDRSSGAPGVTISLAEALREHGHVVDVISFDNVAAPAAVLRYVYPWFVAMFCLRHRVYDVLDLSSGDGWVLALLSRRKTGRGRPLPRPLIVTRSHGLEHVAHQERMEHWRLGLQKLSWRYPLYHGGFRLWECRISFAHAHAALFLNRDDLRHATGRLGVDGARAVQIRNGIAQCLVERAKLLLDQPGQEMKPRHTAFIGRYSEMKGRSCLRTAMTEILTRHPAARLGLFGVGVAESLVLEDFPPALRTRIQVLGSYENRDLPDLLSPYHILAFPTLTEGFGIAVIEAMACGLVPIVTDTPGPISYIEDGRNGIIVPKRDAPALAREINGLIADPGRWARIRRQALVTAIPYSWHNIALEAEQIYERFRNHAARS